MSNFTRLDWIAIKLETKHVICQKLVTFLYKRHIPVIGMEVSSLAWKFVFHRLDHDVKRGPHLN